MANSLYKIEVKQRRGEVKVTAIESSSPSHRYITRQLKLTPIEFFALLADDGVTKWLEGIIPVRTNTG